MKKKKRTTKRTNLKTKALIRKKKQAFVKKAKKTAKQMIALGIKPRNRHKHTQLSVPNLCPFKKDLLEKALRRRQDLKIELEQKKLLKTDRKKNLKAAVEHCRRQMNKGLMVPKSLQKTSWSDNKELKLPRSGWEHKHFYYKELNQVIAASDIIIEVLDARDPLGCRSKEIESKILRLKSNILSGNKRLILLINKIDLIPSDVLCKWMKILKREHPVIAFKASTQSQKKKLHSNLKFNKISSDNKATTNRCIGGGVLVELLKKYSLSLNIKTPITVGFIGYPNTGKSSIINSLKRSQSVGTGFMPGFTTKLAEVKLDSNIRLIDSPGVILNDNEIETRLVLRNALKLQNIDPIETVAHILTVANHKSLGNIYNMNTNKSFKNVSDFLAKLAKKLNHMKSGGVPDLYRCAKLMINDWNHGKIPFYIEPPQIIETNTQVKFVENNQFSKEFDIDGLLDKNNQLILQQVEKQQSNNQNKKYLKLQDEKFVINDNDDNQDNDNNNDDDEDDDLEMNDNNNNHSMDEEIMQTHAFLNA